MHSPFSRAVAPVLLASLVLTASLPGCTSMAPPTVQTQSDPGTDLAAYSTFGWQSVAGKDSSDEPLRILDTNIRTAIRAELTRRGYTETEDHPQLLIAYETETQDKIRSNPLRVGIGVGSFGGNVGGSVGVGSSSVQSYQEGRLVIHVLDAAGNKEVWVGTVSGRINNKNIDAAAVARGVALTMQDFPSRSATPSPP